MEDSRSAPVGFPSTMWSLVRDAGDPGAEGTLKRDALDRLFSRYWKPVYWYVRLACGKDAATAMDLTQSFFLDALETGFIAKADASRGRFRTFLKACLSHFLSDRHRHEHRLRRGGSALHLPIDSADLESAELLAAGREFGPEALFDREWCAAVFRRAVEETRRRCAERGMEAHFEAFRLYDIEGAGALSYQDLAERLKRPEDKIRYDLRAARELFRDCVREEIRETVDSPSDLTDELGELFAWLK